MGGGGASEGGPYFWDVILREVWKVVFGERNLRPCEVGEGFGWFN